MYTFLIEYWKCNDKLIDYFLIAHIFYFLYKNKSDFRRIIDDIEYSNPLIYRLMPMSKYDKENYEYLTKETVFFKCNWKKYDVAKATQDSYYRKVMDEKYDSKNSFLL